MINPQKFFNFFMPSVISFVLYFLILFPISSNYLSLEEFGIRATVLIVISIVLIGSNFGMVWLIRSFYFKLKDEEIKSKSITKAPFFCFANDNISLFNLLIEFVSPLIF